MARVHIVQVASALIVTLGDELDDADAVAFQDELSQRVVDSRARGVLMDVSALEIVASSLGKVLGDTARIVGILGADVGLAGMRPAVAITMVELGLGLDGVTTVRNVDAGLAVLAASDRERDRPTRVDRLQ